jgi:hypothetical protein
MDFVDRQMEFPLRRAGCNLQSAQHCAGRRASRFMRPGDTGVSRHYLDSHLATPTGTLPPHLRAVPRGPSVAAGGRGGSEESISWHTARTTSEHRHQPPPPPSLRPPMDDQTPFLMHSLDV